MSISPDVCVAVPSDPTVSFAVSWHAGSRHDPPGLEGLAYLTGLMVAQGATTAHRYDEVLARLYPLAATYDVLVDKEIATLDGRAHRETLDRYLPLLEDAMLRPAFDRHDFRRLQEDAINDIETTLRYAEDEALAEAMLHARAFRGSGYAHPPEGTVAGLRRITLSDVRAFHRKYYTHGRALSGIGGGFDGAAAARFAHAVGTLPGARTGSLPPLEPEPGLAAGRAGIDVVLIDKPGADASISLGFPLQVLRGDREFYALFIANTWLGDASNPGSRLFQSIRELRGLNYGAYSFLEASPDGDDGMPPINAPRRRQLFEVWIRTLPNEHAVFAIRAALREIGLLVRDGLGEAEFGLMRRFLRKQSLRFAETAGRRLGYALDDRLYGLGESGHLERFAAAMRDLTREDVNRAAAQHLQAGHFTLAIVTGDAQGIRDALVSGQSEVPRYESAKPQAVVTEDRDIAAWPLTVDPQRITIVPAAHALETVTDRRP